MNILRKENEPPYVIAQLGWKYHHLGVPTKEKMPDEKYIPQYKFFVSGFDISPYGIEWMRFEEDSPIHPLIQKTPHIAFEVENLDHELEVHSFNILTPPTSPGSGIRVVMIEHNGAPVELIEFHKK